MSLRIPRGAITALVGQSGVGKSTIVDLLVGLYQPRSGTIRIDGIDLRQVDIGLWRKDIGYIPQEVLLFHDSIRNNVTLYEEGFSDEDVMAALTAAGAREFVSCNQRGAGHRGRGARQPSFRGTAAADLDRPGTPSPPKHPHP